MGDYWYLGYHREEDADYDEDGFAKGTPAHHPARAMMAVVGALEQREPPIKIRKDYSDEFRAFLRFNVGKIEFCEVTTQDPALTRDITFDFRYRIAGSAYVTQGKVHRLLISTQAAFEKDRLYLFANAALVIQNKLMESCDHRWEERRSLPGLRPIYEECSICGMKRDAPKW